MTTSTSAPSELLNHRTVKAVRNRVIRDAPRLFHKTTSRAYESEIYMISLLKTLHDSPSAHNAFTETIANELSAAGFSCNVQLHDIALLRDGVTIREGVQVTVEVR